MLYPSSKCTARGRVPKAGKGSSWTEDSQGCIQEATDPALRQSLGTCRGCGAELHPPAMHRCTVPSNFWPTAAAHFPGLQGSATYSAWFGRTTLRKEHDDSQPSCCGRSTLRLTEGAAAADGGSKAGSGVLPPDMLRIFSADRGCALDASRRPAKTTPHGSESGFRWFTHRQLLACLLTVHPALWIRHKAGGNTLISSTALL